MVTGLNVLITQAGSEDAEEILALQYLAFQSQAALYDDYTIAPLTQTLEELEAQFNNHIFLKAGIDGRIIGSVRGCIDGKTAGAFRVKGNEAE